MPKPYNAGTVRKGSPGIFVVTSTSEIGFICLAGKLGDRVDFLINDETYFLSLAENERRWQVFVQTPTGTRQVPVYEDAPEFLDLTVVVEDKDKRQLVN